MLQWIMNICLFFFNISAFFICLLYRISAVFIYLLCHVFEFSKSISETYAAKNIWSAAVDLIVCQSATAREGVEKLAQILDTYGSSECNIAFIADQKEAWYVEMYTGHQYAAVLLPRDKVSVFGNEFTLEKLSEYEDSIT
ncbi:MAG: C69 family dipeptidase [Eubacterium sp.]|nr:C69 family dipeptidase [Eubacterium sp.]